MLDSEASCHLGWQSREWQSIPKTFFYISLTKLPNNLTTQFEAQRYKTHVPKQRLVPRSLILCGLYQVFFFLIPRILRGFLREIGSKFHLYIYYGL